MVQIKFNEFISHSFFFLGIQYKNSVLAVKLILLNYRPRNNSQLCCGSVKIYVNVRWVTWWVCSHLCVSFHWKTIFVESLHAAYSALRHFPFFNQTPSFSINKSLSQSEVPRILFVLDFRRFNNFTTLRFYDFTTLRKYNFSETQTIFQGVLLVV